MCANVRKCLSIMCIIDLSIVFIVIVINTFVHFMNVLHFYDFIYC